MTFILLEWRPSLAAIATDIFFNFYYIYDHVDRASWSFHIQHCISVADVPVSKLAFWYLDYISINTSHKISPFSHCIKLEEVISKIFLKSNLMLKCMEFCVSILFFIACSKKGEITFPFPFWNMHTQQPCFGSLCLLQSKLIFSTILVSTAHKLWADK